MPNIDIQHIQLSIDSYRPKLLIST